MTESIARNRASRRAWERIRQEAANSLGSESREKKVCAQVQAAVELDRTIENLEAQKKALLESAVDMSIEVDALVVDWGFYEATGKSTFGQRIC